MLRRIQVPFVLLSALTLLVGSGCGDSEGSSSSGAGGSTGGGASGGSGGSTTGGSSAGGAGGDGGSSDGGMGGTGGAGGDGPPMCIDAASCQAVIDTYAPCGGDPQGTWTIVNGCSYEVDDDTNPECPAAVLAGGINGASGTAVIDATTIAYTDYAIDGYYHTETPVDCIAPVTCAIYEEMLVAQFSTGCCGEVDGVCICDAVGTQEVGSVGADYTVNGNTITIGGSDSDFCVQGGVLTIRSDGGTPDETFTVFEQQ